MWHHIGQQQQDASVDASTPSAATAMPAPQVDALQEIMQRLNFMEQAADGVQEGAQSNETLLILQRQDRTLQVLVDVLRLDVAHVRDLLETCGYDIAMAVATYYSQLALLQTSALDGSAPSSDGSGSSGNKKLDKKRGWAPSGESPAKIRVHDKILLLRGTPVGWECCSKPNGVVFFRHIKTGIECTEALKIELPSIPSLTLPSSSSSSTSSSSSDNVFRPVDYKNGGDKV